MNGKIIAVACATLAAAPLAALEFTPESTQVAIPAKAPGPVQLAAEEMTNFLSRVFGRKVPLVRKVTYPKTLTMMQLEADKLKSKLKSKKLNSH